MVRVAGCCAKVLRPIRGITAGTVFATIELRLLLIQWLDEATKLSSLVSLTVYVDDISVEAVASETAILRELSVVAQHVANSQRNGHGVVPY